MARMADARRMYSGDKVTTTPERLITMLYDRLMRDLVAAEQAIVSCDRESANDELNHAQAIVAELFGALDLDAWQGARQLAQLYTWLLQQLLHANVEQDVELVRHCRRLVEPLAEAWHQAAAQVSRTSIQQNLQPVRQMGAAV
jgi:flagellar protein FliS